MNNYRQLKTSVIYLAHNFFVSNLHQVSWMFFLPFSGSLFIFVVSRRMSRRHCFCRLAGCQVELLPACQLGLTFMVKTGSKREQKHTISLGVQVWTKHTVISVIFCWPKQSQSQPGFKKHERRTELLMVQVASSHHKGQSHRIEEKIASIIFLPIY